MPLGQLSRGRRHLTSGFYLHEIFAHDLRLGYVGTNMTTKRMNVLVYSGMIMLPIATLDILRAI